MQVFSATFEDFLIRLGDLRFFGSGCNNRFHMAKFSAIAAITGQPIDRQNKTDKEP